MEVGTDWYVPRYTAPVFLDGVGSVDWLAASAMNDCCREADWLVDVGLVDVVRVAD